MEKQNHIVQAWVFAIWDLLKESKQTTEIFPNILFDRFKAFDPVRSMASGR